MKPRCCFIEEDSPCLGLEGWEIDSRGCSKDAEWVIFHGPGGEDYTESCSQHVGEMLTDALEHKVYPIKIWEVER